MKNTFICIRVFVFYSRQKYWMIQHYDSILSIPRKNVWVSTSLKKIPLANPKLNPSSFHFQVYCHYYNDLNKDDFPFNEDYLGERVKRGMEVENTFKQCYRRWLKDFKIALYISDSEVLE